MEVSLTKEGVERRLTEVKKDLEKLHTTIRDLSSHRDTVVKLKNRLEQALLATIMLEGTLNTHPAYLEGKTAARTTGGGSPYDQDTEEDIQWRAGWNFVQDYA